jgi:hypothetical protein
MRPELTPEEQERHRRRDSLPVLPDSYHPIVQRIGLRLTLRLARRLGGEKVQFPAQPRPGSRVVKAIGADAVVLLHGLFLAEEIKLSTAWSYLNMVDARRLRRQGYTVLEIVQRLRISRSTAEHYTRDVQPGPARRKGGAKVVDQPHELFDIAGVALPVKPRPPKYPA